LLQVLGPLAASLGLEATYETGVYRPGRSDDYRQPDIVVSAPEHQSARGIEGRAELVVEIRSPHDEAWDKLPFFAEMGIPEVLILDTDEPTLLQLATDRYEPVTPGTDGWITLACLPVSFRPHPDGGIETRWNTDTTVI
jgi:Uma2 family endonuclease